MTTGYERIIGLNTPGFFVKDSFTSTPEPASVRRVILLRAVPGIGRFPTVQQLDDSSGHDAMRIVSLTGVPTIATLKTYD